MKPTYLEVSAFGPFAGQTVLPIGQIVSEGVFLVHGATGAGKTTVFDAISFALFGNASGENRPTDSFRSDFADENTKTYVILEFTHGGKTYKIERSPAYRRPKQRGDGYTDSKAEAVLTMPDGLKIVGYQMVTDKIEEILSVDWKQFKQISMLAQGEFLKLLTVESKERGEIFRKVFHTGELGRIGRELKDRMLTVKRTCEELDASLLQYYSGIEIPKDSSHKESFDEFLNTRDIHRTEGFPAMLVELLHEEEAEQEKCREQLTWMEQQLTELRVKEAKTAEWLEKKKELAKLEEELPEILSLDQQTKEEKQRLILAKKADSDIRMPREVYLTAKEETRQLFTAIEEKEKQVKDLKEEEQRILLYYQKAQADKTGMEQLLARMEQQRNETKLLLEKEEKQKEYQRKEQDAVRLKESEENLRRTISEKETRIAQCRSLQDRLTEIFHSGRALEARERELKDSIKAMQEAAERFASYEKILKNYEYLTQELSDMIAKRQVVSLELQQLEAAYTFEQAGMLAMNLSVGQPCPVCGSTEHPMPAKPAGRVPDKEELGRKRNECEELREKIENYGREAASEKATMELLLTQMGIPVEGFSLELQLKQQEESRQLLEKELTELETQLDELVKEQEKGLNAREEAAETEKELMQLRMDLEELLTDCRRVESERELLLQSIRRIEFDATCETSQESEEKLRALETEHSEKKEFIYHSEQEYQNWNNKLQSETAVLEQMISQKLARLQREQYALEDFEKALLRNGFADDGEYMAAVLSEGEMAALEEKTVAAENRLLRYKERRNFLEEEVSKTVPQDTDRLMEQLEALNNSKNILQAELTGRAARIDNNEKVLKNVTGCLEKRTRLQAEYSSIVALSNVANGEMSGKDRLPFEQYVQAFYFEQVLLEANMRLKKMSGGRYALLRRTEAENRRSVTGLDLEIMDYFTGKARSVKSLSGGESFKAALSLALGLSDVIQGYAGGVVIETMFVDEGFGSLDKDSLEQAVAILQDLATDNRIVGIISHVEELKECIDKKILLQKGTKGSYIVYEGV